MIFCFISLSAQVDKKDPLIVINGKISNIKLSSLDPNAIESVTVSKSQTAKDAYGILAENGVISIITKDYVKNIHDNILWSELGDLQTWQGTIRLWKKGKRAISILASIPSIPNFTLLMSLIRHLSKIAQTTPLPLQDMKNEKNKSPEKLQQAIALIKSGDKESGQKLLFEIISSDPDNEAAWLWRGCSVRFSSSTFGHACCCPCSRGPSWLKGSATAPFLSIRSIQSPKNSLQSPSLRKPPRARI